MQHKQSDKVPVVLVDYDEEDAEREVSREEAETLAETYGLNFAEYNIGSKDDRKCDIILSQLIRSIKSFELGKKNQPTSGHLNVFEIVIIFCIPHQRLSWAIVL